MLILGLSKRFGPTPAAVRLAILAALLHGVAFSQTHIPVTKCTFSNGLAEGFFGGVTISGWFTQGLAPADISEITVNDLQISGTYTFTGPLNGLGYVAVSQIFTPCILLPCPGPGSAGLHLAPESGNSTILLDFVDDGEDFTGSTALSCSAYAGPPPPPPNSQFCPLNVTPSPGGPNSKDGKPINMNANYTPVVNGAPVGLATAASLCLVDSFNFVQQVNVDAHPPQDYQGNTLIVPYPDLPAGGYCKYIDGICVPGGPTSNAYPFYWRQVDLNGGDLGCSPGPVKTANTLLFQDCPAEPSLKQGDPAMSFTTSLVGIVGTCTTNPETTEDCSTSTTSPFYTFSWTSSYDGTTTGGVAQRGGDSPLDPTSGTGGVTITAINGVQFPPVIPPGQIFTTASGLAYSRVSKTFTGTVTMTNVSGALISGPLQVVFFGLPATVTLMTATNNLWGTPYVTVPALAGIAPGQSITVSVQFSNPSNAIINLTPEFYTGSFQ